MLKKTWPSQAYSWNPRTSQKTTNQLTGFLSELRCRLFKHHLPMPVAAAGKVVRLEPRTFAAAHLLAPVAQWMSYPIQDIRVPFPAPTMPTLNAAEATHRIQSARTRNAAFANVYGLLSPTCVEKKNVYVLLRPKTHTSQSQGRGGGWVLITWSLLLLIPNYNCIYYKCHNFRFWFFSLSRK